MDQSVRIVFLGGLGEIGRNCCCIEVDDRILLVDCGIMFPDADMPGVDLVLPDFTYLRENADRVDAILLTHAHEDHAGGIAFLLRDVSVPVYGSELSLALARNRIEEAGMLGRTELIPVADGERRRIGPVDCQFIPVTHSVPHGFAIAFFTPVGTIIHSGDFKLDLTPVDGRRTNLAMLGDIASREGGIRLLMSDSTNAERPGFTPSESTVGVAMRSLFREYPDKRFIITSFASHLHRVQQVAQAAVANGRKIAFVGRSMQQNITMARERGFIDIPAWAVIDIEETPKLAPGEVCIVCTGSQGEPMSALSLMAAHEHKHVKISADDVVVISAHAIPGNESNVSRVIDSLHRAGAEVVHDRTSPVHVSGHASQDELKFMLNLLEPEWFVPVHGEYRHLVHHAQLARKSVSPPIGSSSAKTATSSPSRPTVPTANGARFPPGTCTSTESSATSATACCAIGVLSEEGVVVVILTVDTQAGKVLTGPEIVTRGWVYAPEAEDLIEDAKQAVSTSIEGAIAEGALDLDTLRRHARRSLGRFIDERTKRRPIVIPVVMEV